MFGLDLVWLVLAALALLGVVNAWRSHAPSDAHVRDRTPDHSVWTKTYTEAEQARVFAVLEVLVDSFLLSDEDRDKLRPSDKLLDLYNAAYPGGGPDALEFESLAEELEKRFAVSRSLTIKLASATVGDLVEWTRVGGALSDTPITPDTSL